MESEATGLVAVHESGSCVEHTKVLLPAERVHGVSEAFALGASYMVRIDLLMGLLPGTLRLPLGGASDVGVDSPLLE